jgi:hypothetical protein
LKCNSTGRLVSKAALKPGKAHILLEVEPQASPDPKSAKSPQTVEPGDALLTINGILQGKANFTNINGASYTETLDVGCDLGSPVSSAYQSPDRFTGKIDQVTIELK